MDSKTYETIYVQLFAEGTPCFRPALALQIASNIYVLCEEELNDHSQYQQWEFLPGAKVLVERKNLSGGPVLVAVEALEGVSYIGEFGIVTSQIINYDLQQNHLTVNLKSGGYGRLTGTEYQICFSEVLSINQSSPEGLELYGLRKTIKPNQPNCYCFDTLKGERVELSNGECCFQIVAKSAILENPYDHSLCER
jgi:hypothetical protein